MNYNKILLTTALLLGLNTHAAQASLTSYTANGVDLVRMQGGGFDVSFTKDGNLFQTLASSYAGGASAFVNAVIASVPGGKINDTPNDRDTPAYSGYHSMSSSDFDTTTGSVSWFGAKAYVSYLNSISYAGSNQWSLPGWTDTGAPGPQFGLNGTDVGYNLNPSSSPLAQLYYGELNKKARFNTSGVVQSNYGVFGNNGAQVADGAVGGFSNVQSSEYWLGTEYAYSPVFEWRFNSALRFNAKLGNQSFDTTKNNLYYAWAITPGQVTTVPVPGAVWLFGTGLVGMLGLKRRKPA